MKQDIEAKMKDMASSGRVGYWGLYFFYSLEGHLHVLLSQQGVCLQKQRSHVSWKALQKKLANFPDIENA